MLLGRPLSVPVFNATPTCRINYQNVASDKPYSILLMNIWLHNVGTVKLILYTEWLHLPLVVLATVVASSWGSASSQEEEAEGVAGSPLLALYQGEEAHHSTVDPSSEGSSGDKRKLKSSTATHTRYSHLLWLGGRPAGRLLPGLLLMWRVIVASGRIAVLQLGLRIRTSEVDKRRQSNM